MAPAKQAAKPFPDTLRALLDEHDVSQRELTRRTQKRGWGSLRTTTELLSGDLRPTLGAMESIATALQVKPDVFAEYRLGQMRALLDPDQVGFKKAVKNLELFEALRQAEDAVEPKPHRPKVPGRRRRAAGGGQASSS